MLGYALRVLLTHELHLPLPDTLHLHGIEVRQVIILVSQRVLLQAEGSQAPRCVPTRKDAVWPICRGEEGAVAA